MVRFAQDFGSGLMPANCLNLQLSKNVEIILGQLRGRPWRRDPSPPHQEIIVALGELDVCDGAHRIFVMKKGTPVRMELPFRGRCEAVLVRGERRSSSWPPRARAWGSVRTSRQSFWERNGKV